MQEKIELNTLDSEKSNNLNTALQAIKVLNDFTWKAAELAIQSNLTKSLLYSFKLLKSSNNVILNPAIYIANELSNGKSISTVLSGVIPEIEKSLFKDIVVTEAVKQSAVVLGKIGSKAFGSLLGEILFSSPLNPSELASIKITTNKRIDSMDHSQYQALMLKSLIEAVKTNDLKKMTEALDVGADINALSEEGAVWPKWKCTALHAAAMKGHTQAVELLLSRGANINAKCGSGTTPLQQAALHNNHTDIVHKLIAKGADPATARNTARSNKITNAYFEKLSQIKVTVVPPPVTIVTKPAAPVVAKPVTPPVVAKPALPPVKTSPFTNKPIVLASGLITRTAVPAPAKTTSVPVKSALPPVKTSPFTNKPRVPASGLIARTLEKERQQAAAQRAFWASPAGQKKKKKQQKEQIEAYMSYLKWIIETESNWPTFSQEGMVNHVTQKILEEGWQNIDPGVMQRVTNIIQGGANIPPRYNFQSSNNSSMGASGNSINKPENPGKQQSPGKTAPHSSFYKPAPESIITTKPLEPLPGLKQSNTSKSSPIRSCPEGQIGLPDYPHNPDQTKCFKII